MKYRAYYVGEDEIVEFECNSPAVAAKMFLSQTKEQKNKAVRVIWGFGWEKGQVFESHIPGSSDSSEVTATETKNEESSIATVRDEEDKKESLSMAQYLFSAFHLGCSILIFFQASLIEGLGFFVGAGWIWFHSSKGLSSLLHDERKWRTVVSFIQGLLVLIGFGILSYSECSLSIFGVNFTDKTLAFITLAFGLFIGLRKPKLGVLESGENRAEMTSEPSIESEEDKHPKAASRSRSGKAIASFVLSILLGLALCGRLISVAKGEAEFTSGGLFYLFFALLVVLLGQSARKQIRKSQGAVSGSKLALIGILFGYLVFILYHGMLIRSCSSRYADLIVAKSQVNDTESLNKIIESAIEDSDLELKEALAYSQQKPFSGWSKRIIAGDKVLTQFRDGKEDGFVIILAPNGEKRTELLQKGGKFRQASSWMPNGEKCPLTNIGLDGNGICIFYNEDGTESRRLTFKDGEIAED